MHASSVAGWGIESSSDPSDGAAQNGIGPILSAATRSCHLFRKSRSVVRLSLFHSMSMVSIHLMQRVRFRQSQSSGPWTERLKFGSEPSDAERGTLGSSHVLQVNLRGDLKTTLPWKSGPSARRFANAGHTRFWAPGLTLYICRSWTDIAATSQALCLISFIIPSQRPDIPDFTRKQCPRTRSAHGLWPDVPF